jgi:5'-methylthioadenosine phosphorylase
MVVGIIGGSGLEDFLTGKEKEEIPTPFGGIVAVRGEVGGVGVIFIPRHGFQHERPPHRVNYKGNIYALRKMGVRRIVSTCSVGSLNPSFQPGDLVTPDQIVDLTKARDYTFYHDEAVHIDATEPFCPSIRGELISAAERLDLRAWSHGTYICFEGPRFETKAEIRMARILGGDLVGMTLAPEATLARELALCYGSISIVTNWAASIQEVVTEEEVRKMMKAKREVVEALFREALPSIERLGKDGCRVAEERAEVLMRRLEP